MSTCKIHNIRFYEPKLEAIVCMSYEIDSHTLAVARADASIEIWNLVDAPCIERTIPNSSSNRNVQSVAWYNGRLFSIGIHGFLIEYNMLTLSKKAETSVTGQAGYCVDINRKGQIAVGTEQGYINIFQAEENDVLFEKFLDKQEGRVLCLKYNSTGDFIASGSASAVRVWDIKTGHALHRMTTGRAKDNSETIVWCVDFVDDLTIVSGDSRGKITFWDLKIGSQIESYQTHQADILSLVVTEDQKTLYCAGIDPNIVSYVKVNVKSGNHKWVKSIQRKVHDHDVRSMVISGTKVYSGGVDGYLACSYYPPKTLLKYPPILQNPCVSVSPQKRYILLRYSEHVELWSLGQSDDTNRSEDYNGLLSLKCGPKKLLDLQRTVKDDEGNEVTEGVVCSSLSENGKWIVYSTDTALRLFSFYYEIGSTPSLNNVVLPKECDSAVLTKFTPNNLQLVIAPRSGGLQVLDTHNDSVKLAQTLNVSSVLSDTVTFLLFSSCGSYLIAADPRSNIGVWKKKRRDWEFYCKLPKYNKVPTAISMQTNTLNLWVAYSDQKIVEYDLAQKALTRFSRNFDKKNINKLLHRAFPIRNITFDPRRKDIAILHDDTSMVIINKEKKLPTSDSKIPRIDSSQLSSDMSNDSTNLKTSKHAFHSIRKYKHLVHLQWVSDDEMIAVEVSPLSLLEQLPPCLQQNAFGTK